MLIKIRCLQVCRPASSDIFGLWEQHIKYKRSGILELQRICNRYSIQRTAQNSANFEKLWSRSISYGSFGSYEGDPPPGEWQIGGLGSLRCFVGFKLFCFFSIRFFCLLLFKCCWSNILDVVQTMAFPKPSWLRKRYVNVRRKKDHPELSCTWNQRYFLVQTWPVFSLKRPIWLWPALASQFTSFISFDRDNDLVVLNPTSSALHCIWVLP